ncbi:putative repeat protein (TIGR01451 family) [Streptosporangium becharense]|uniref:Putative repeat protein (TIGR01451 family) n=1 Tax=Streptosporangium becharense TaxID=1816182 RepID=A0A7W9MIE6_9ACTN|nr:PKD domain-containing protein [Streptosporangium becharense]MBB2913940.1 putative repeat protein (TIGR01451 family) [Streptosporangium becharense]MBB5821399.1 putative repeat protein (TIGR01451 family) [Streptosporangium becharense]
MAWLFSRAFTRRIALPVLAAVAGSLITPLPADAAPSPAPPRDEKAARTAPETELIDLGSLNTSQGYLGKINNRGQVVGSVMDGATHHAALFSRESFTDIAEAFGEPLGSIALDVNDDGTVVGNYTNNNYSYLFKDGKLQRITPNDAMAINKHGEVAGYYWLRDPDGAVTKITAFKGQYMEAASLNDHGSVVGTADMDPDPEKQVFRAFRTKPGEPLNIEEDRLEYSGGTAAVDVNNRGLVAGYATDEGGGYVPVIWDENGVPRMLATRTGGMLNAINEAGVAVGWSRDASGKPYATMFVDGVEIDLNTLRPPGSTVTLTKATGINDRNQIAVVGRQEGSITDHAFLLDLSGGGPVITELTLETQKYPSENWVPVGDDGVIEGNRVRVTVSVNNPNPYSRTWDLQLFDKVSGRRLSYEKSDMVVPGQETVTKRVIWDTDGFAWHEGQGRSERAVVVKLAVGDVEDATREQPVVVRPKPLIMVHGLASNAEAWGDYGPYLEAVHPLLEGYAVGDGKVTGAMDTGVKLLPFLRTKNFVENTAELEKYVKNVRTLTGAWHVNILAKGMGGLFTRSLIQGRLEKTPSHKPMVSRLLQAGTPNRGTPLADMAVIAATANPALLAWYPSIEYNTTYFAGSFNRNVTDLRGTRISSLVGVGRSVPSPDLSHPTLVDGDGFVPANSARHNYKDVPTTKAHHDEILMSPVEFRDYLLPRLASDGTSGGGVSPLAEDATVKPDTDGAKSGKDGAKSGAVTAAAGTDAGDGENGGTGAVSVFATPSATVEAGTTASVPLQVPAAAVFGLVGTLPETVGVLLRDPSGKVAASYTAGDKTAKQTIQGLSVATPQAGAWKVEITNTGTQPVTADLSAWLAGNPVKATATAEQTGDDGRVKVTATVTDDGAPVTGATVKATLTLVTKDATQHELTLTEDGDTGVYTATTGEAPADGLHSVVVRAETAKGLRTAQTVVEVAKPDLREFTLTLSAQPGGSVSASPAQERYRSGTKVTLTPKAEAGRVPQGWVVDGQERPGGGPLELVMDGEHTVVARFGSYTVTELGAPPGGDAAKTRATAINDRGQVAATAQLPGGRTRAARWENGKLTDLGTLPCADTSSHPCAAVASGITETGRVSGWSSVTREGTPEKHAALFGDGTVTDLHPASGAAGVDSWALDVNDNGQTFGMLGGKYVLWDQGPPVQLPAEPAFHGEIGTYKPECCSPLASRINARGVVGGAYVTERGVDGVPMSWAPATHDGGTTTKLAMPGTLPLPAEPGGGEPGTCVPNVGRVHDVATGGMPAGEVLCGLRSDPHAVVWDDGTPTVLGVGRASAVNDHGLVAGHAQGSSRFAAWKPALWLAGVKYELADLLPRPMCPEKKEDTTEPCMHLTTLYDVNASGQIVAQGFVRDRSATQPGFDQRDRSFVLTPTTARADLKVTHTVSATEPGPGSTVTWTATVTNTGPDTATDVRLDVLIPQTVTGAACDTWRGVCTAVKDGFRNTTAKLPSGSSATVEITATLPAGLADGTVLKSTASTASIAVADPEPGDNTAEVTATVRHALDKTGVNWPDTVQVGASSYPVEVTLTNRGNAPMPITVIATEGPFGQTNGCPPELAVGKACTTQVTFTPTQVGPATGKLTFTTGDGTAPAYTVALTGTGVAANAKPVITLPAEPLRGQVGRPFTLKVDFTDADTTDTHEAWVVWDGGMEDASVIQRPGGGTVTVTKTFTAPVPEGRVIVMVTDSKQGSVMQPIPYVITETAPDTAPVVTAGPDVELTTGEKLQRTVTFTDPGSTSWTATVDYGDGTGPKPVTVSGQNVALEHTWATAGKYPVTVTVRDDGGLQTSAVFFATVTTAPTPNQAPQVKVNARETIAEGTVWIGAGTFSDPDSTSWTATADYGDGTGTHPVPLVGRQPKMEHAFADDGEYTVTLAVTDDKGATGTVQVKVKVTNAAPKVSLTGSPADVVVPVGTAVTLGATFTDPGTADTHTATWSVAGQTLPGVVTGTGGKGTVTGVHTFATPGQYEVAVTVTDDDGAATTSDTLADGRKVRVLVYNPHGAVVGAGTLAVPAGACTLNAACAGPGMALFTLKAHHLPGARPAATGEHGGRNGDEDGENGGEGGRDATADRTAAGGTAGAPVGWLHYRAPGFELRETAYTLLTVVDGTATLRGTGKVTGAGAVTFEVTATDAARPGTRTDRLRLKVWDGKGELVYDSRRTGPATPVIGVIRVTG